MARLQNWGHQLASEFYGEEQAQRRWNLTYFPDETQRENLRRSIPHMLAELEVMLDDLDAYGDVSWSPSELEDEDALPSAAGPPHPRVRVVLVFAAWFLVMAAGFWGVRYVLNLTALKPVLESNLFPGTTYSNFVSGVLIVLITGIPLWLSRRAIATWAGVNSRPKSADSIQI